MKYVFPPKCRGNDFSTSIPSHSSWITFGYYLPGLVESVAVCVESTELLEVGVFFGVPQLKEMIVIVLIITMMIFFIM